MKRRDKIALVAVIVALFVVIFVASALTDDRIISKPTCTAIIVISTVAAVAYFVFLLCKLRAAQKNQNRRHLDRYGATMSGTLKHLSGLPLAKNLPVEILYCPDRFVFRKDTQEITVSMDKVTGIDVTTGQHTGRKAITGAASGKYVAGGAAGAALGALASIEMLLIISYTSDGKNKSIIFDASAGGTFPTKLEKDFRQKYPQKKAAVIEL